MAEPLVITSQGSFFVNARTVHSDANSGLPLPVFDLDLGASGDIVVDQMYVEYQIPSSHRTGSPPIVLVHGGGHTGACWRSTPDGREGWATYFLRAGFAVYVVDQVTRGRSGYDATAINVARRTANGSGIPNTFQFSADTLWAVLRLGPRVGTFHAGGQFPADSYDDYAPQLVPDMNFGLPDPFITVHALAALLDRIGPAVVVTHSESGEFGFGLTKLRPTLVRGIVEVEGGSTVGSDDLAVHAAVPFLTIYGDFLDDQALYLATSAAARQLVDLLNAAAGDATYLHLPEQGIHGNGHMMMLERNSDEIASLIVDWLDAHVEL